MSRLDRSKGDNMARRHHLDMKGPAIADVGGLLFQIYIDVVEVEKDLIQRMNRLVHRFLRHE